MPQLTCNSICWGHAHRHAVCEWHLVDRVEVEEMATAFMGRRQRFTAFAFRKPALQRRIVRWLLAAVQPIESREVFAVLKARSFVDCHLRSIFDLLMHALHTEANVVSRQMDANGGGGSSVARDRSLQSDVGEKCNRASRVRHCQLTGIVRSHIFLQSYRKRNAHDKRVSGCSVDIPAACGCVRILTLVQLLLLLASIRQLEVEATSLLDGSCRLRMLIQSAQ